MHHGIARVLAREDYQTNDWRKFYKSLVFLFEIENFLFEKEIKEKYDFEAKKKMIKVMINNIDKAEQEMQEGGGIDSESFE